MAPPGLTSSPSIIPLELQHPGRREVLRVGSFLQLPDQPTIAASVSMLVSSVRGWGELQSGRPQPLLTGSHEQRMS